MGALKSLRLTRRRALTAIAGATAAILTRSAGARESRLFEWRGTAMGADARIALYHHDKARAKAAIGAAIAEVERLEAEFSLYRPDSALSRLNRAGRLENPSLDMLYLLRESVRFGEMSYGAFDVTVQPLWRLYVDHFARYPDDEQGPRDEVIADACARVDYHKVQVSPDRIVLEPGMAVTLNGIAQGYITDRVTDVLRAHGFADVLINLGEFRTLGRHPDGQDWTMGLSVPGHLERLLATPSLANRAAATSAGSGTTFDRAGRHHHLFHPGTGRSVGEYASVTVFANLAMTADALSTMLFVAPRAQVPRILRQLPSVEAWLIGEDKAVQRLQS